MKTIGMLGGMSWESTTSYYKALNLGVKNALGGLHSAKICMISVDFAEIETLQHQGDWQQTANILTEAAKSVEAGGADFLLICTNTMHKVADEIASNMMAIFAAVRTEWADGTAVGAAGLDGDVAMAVSTLASLRLLPAGRVRH